MIFFIKAQVKDKAQWGRICYYYLQIIFPPLTVQSNWIFDFEMNIKNRSLVARWFHSLPDCLYFMPHSAAFCFLDWGPDRFSTALMLDLFCLPQPWLLNLAFGLFFACLSPSYATGLAFWNFFLLLNSRTGLFAQRITVFFFTDLPHLRIILWVFVSFNQDVYRLFVGKCCIWVQSLKCDRKVNRVTMT